MVPIGIPVCSNLRSRFKLDLPVYPGKSWCGQGISETPFPNQVSKSRISRVHESFHEFKADVVKLEHLQHMLKDDRTHWQARNTRIQLYRLNHCTCWAASGYMGLKGMLLIARSSTLTPSLDCKFVTKVNDTSQMQQTRLQ